VAVTGYSREEILRVVKRHESEIRFCYESALRKHPDLAGKVTARWVIAQTGDVETAEITESSLGDPAAEACILERVKRWRFPQPEGEEVVVTFPWVFKVAGRGEADGVR
jgi:TonB family protein